MSNILLKLFVAGQTPKSAQVIAHLFRVCEAEFANQYELEIIDVLEQPQRAEQEKILVTPTLIKEVPLPMRRLIGDFSDKEKLLAVLKIQPTTSFTI
ncbi:MAG: circadian clock protein KaiB [Symploca sp. SIO3C6]|uniref:Circadian clock protein KaiB n=1 Tax=Symploca sp. SIO1C4 TaxID=2607765 RepID=A0A6B3N9T2_9CYAN|nr:circadian clock protein KaiB [Symploca sp. SIO3C6]NER27635.1 circadian clock protein KaiB [Symploca sp. SIO1C4]NET03961.1 circadian clock protein KaiB [Symploca sp. SIO2B6]